MENFLIHNKTLTAKDWLLDSVIALAAFAFGAVQIMLAVWNVVMPDETLRRLLGIENVVPSLAAFVALALTTLPLVLRRRFPWPVFLFVLITFLGLQDAFRSFSLPILGPMIALFTIANERSRTEAIVATALAVSGLLLMGGTPRAASIAFLTRFQNIAFIITAAFAGYAYRMHRNYVEETERRAFEAERTREEVAARRVEEERVSIARDIHDIVAHSLSAVTIQTAAAERLIDNDPAAAKKAVTTARETAKKALEEMRGMVGVLRHGGEDVQGAPTTPTAGTERLEDLVAYLQQAGIVVTLDISGYDETRVPAYRDRALYGIAREAVTNIVRHAQAKNATLRLACDNTAACLVVENDSQQFHDAKTGGVACGNTPSTTECDAGQSGENFRTTTELPVDNATGGHGIQGMRERAHLLGGTLEATRRRDGGFRVVATLPLAD